MFRASLCPSSGKQDVCYCMWCAALVLLDVVGSGCGALRCRVWALWRQCPTTATNHIQQNQRSTPHAVIRLILLKMGIMMPETCWEIVKNKHLIVASCWFSLTSQFAHDARSQKPKAYCLHVYVLSVCLCSIYQPNFRDSRRLNL